MSSVCCGVEKLSPCRRPTTRVCVIFLILFLAVLFNANVVIARRDHDEDGTTRQREHFDDILLRPDPYGNDDNSQSTQEVLHQLRRIYHEKIKPVEEQFQYADLRRHVMSEADIHSKPIVLVVGPWSTGKSTLINYILGIEDQLERLYTGAEPTTADFTVLSYGDDYRTIEGLVLATDSSKPFSSMEKFGQTFLEHLLGIEINAPLLRNVTFIDTPGILENRRQQERGYPYNDVMRWLVHRSDLIFVIFDPTKLDVGYELETLFKQLKGKESVIRIILNKADSFNEQELMRVYGALFWSLSPLINVTEAPRVYVGSFWSQPYSDEELGEMLLEEEKSLLNDMYEVIRNRIYNKIAFLRQHAIRVRIHALLVDSYVAQYRKHKSFFKLSDEALAKQICQNPVKFNVYKTILSHPNVSEYDLPEPDEYREFFRINPLTDQRSLGDFKSYFSKKGYLDKLNEAIGHDLPTLLQRYQRGEADNNNKNWCKSRKSGIPCFGDVASDLWAMQKRYPNAEQFFSKQSVEDEESGEKALPKYRKAKKLEPVSEEMEVVEEEEIEEVDTEVPPAEKPTKVKVASVIRKGKPKVEVKVVEEEIEEISKEEEGEEETMGDVEEEDQESLTLPMKTVSVAETVERDIQEEVETLKIVTKKSSTKQSVDEVESAKPQQQRQPEVKTGVNEQKLAQKKIEIPPTKTPAPEKRTQQPDDIIKVKQPPAASAGAAAKSSKAAATETLKKTEPVIHPTVKESASIPSVSAGHVKKPSKKEHPTVEELIDEDNNKPHGCSKYRKNCDYKLKPQSKEKIQKKTDNKPKCLPYRKSCQVSDEESTKPPVKAAAGHGKPPEKQKAAKVEGKVEAKPEQKQVTKEKTEDGVKCLPYRKTCQPVVREKSADKSEKSLTGSRCPPYRKSCKQTDDEEVKKEEKREEKPIKQQKPASIDKKEVKIESKPKVVEKPKVSAAPETKKKEVVKAEEKVAPKKVAVDAKRVESKKDEKSEEKPEILSAKYKYRKIREDLPEELKEKFKQKLAKLEAEKHKKADDNEQPKKCFVYRKSCKVEVAPTAKASHHVKDFLENFDFLGDAWNLIFSIHWPSSGKTARKSTSKCHKYRKNCTPIELAAEEAEEEEPVKKCPPYRKNCQPSEPKVEKVDKKCREKSEESRSAETEAHHGIGSDENGIPPTQERQKYDSKEVDSGEEQSEEESEEKKPNVKPKVEEKKVVKETYKRRGVAASTIEHNNVPETNNKETILEEATEEAILEEPVVESIVQDSQKSEQNLQQDDAEEEQHDATLQESQETDSSENVPLEQADETEKPQSIAEEDEISGEEKEEEIIEKKVEPKVPERVELDIKTPDKTSVKLTAKDKYRKIQPVDDAEKDKNVKHAAAEHVESKSSEKAAVKLTSKDKYRKIQPAGDEDKINKKVESKDVEAKPSDKTDVKLTAREKYRKSPPLGVKSDGKKDVAGGQPNAKCHIYRKSCQNVDSSSTPELSKKVSSEEKPQIQSKPKSSSEQSAKEKYRKHAEEPAKKCLPYRKSCTVEESQPKAEKIEAPSVEKHKQYTRTQPTKCLPYRKSCQNKVENDNVMHSSDHKESTKVKTPSVQITKSYSDSRSTGVKKCLPYRKSCTTESVAGAGHRKEDAQNIHDNVKSTQSPKSYSASNAVGKKCLPYRKSCTVESEIKEVPKKEAVQNKQDKNSKTVKIPKDSKVVADKKCLPYRKSCTVESVTHGSHEKHHEKAAVQQQQPSVTASGHCIKYRKSCNEGGQQPQQQQIKKNLTNKDVIYVIDKETGKQKKLCRKKKPNGVDSNIHSETPVPNADSLTSKMQNKWKKNAHLDSVMAA